MAEDHLVTIDRLVREVVALIAVLRDVPFASVSFVPSNPHHADAMIVGV